MDNRNDDSEKELVSKYSRFALTEPVLEVGYQF